MFYDSLIIFPPLINKAVSLVKRKSEDKYSIHYTEPPVGWNTLTESIPIETLRVGFMQTLGDFCIATGRVNNITVIECYDNKLLSEVRTPQINTQYSSLYVFNYESCLYNIHGLMNCVNIINDDKFITIDYNSCIMYQNQQILSIPREILIKLLHESDAHSYSNVDEKIIELLTPLPDIWFNKLDLMRKIVNMIRNVVVYDDMRKDTLTKLIVDRSYSFNANDVDTFLSAPMTDKDSRYNVSTLMKELDNETFAKLKEIRENQRRTRKMIKPKKLLLIYTQDALTKLSDIKAIDRTLNTKKIIAMDTRFEIVRLNICKSCNGLFKSGCCPNYARSNNSTAAFVKNASISK